MFELKLDRRKKQSVSEQVELALVQGIQSQVFSYSRNLPSPNDLAILSGLSMNEINRIYASLEKQGLINQVKGRYVPLVINVPSIYFNQIVRIVDIFELNQLTMSVEKIKIENRECPDEIFNFGFYKEDPFLFYSRMFYGNNKPLLVADTYLSLRRFPIFRDIDIEKVAYWDVMHDYNGDTMKRQTQKLSYIDANAYLKAQFKDESIETVFKFEAFLFNQDDLLIDYTIMYTPNSALNLFMDFELEG